MNALSGRKDTAVNDINQKRLRKSLTPLTSSFSAKRSINDTSITNQTLDEASWQHVRSLLTTWLQHSEYSESLLAVLMPILQRVVGIWETACEPQFSCSATLKETPETPNGRLDHSRQSSPYDTLFLEVLESNTVEESRFLPEAKHGDALGTLIANELGETWCRPWPKSLQGGTIRIYGIPLGYETEILTKVIAASVYTLWSLWLENRVMRDYNILALPPKEPVQTVSYTSARSLLRWLLGGKESIASKQSDTTRASKRRFSAISEKVEGIKRRASSTMLLGKHKAEPEIATHLGLDDPHRFAKLRKSFEEALVSSSPYCRYPAPRLLTRLHDEEIGFDTIRSFAASLPPSAGRRDPAPVSIAACSRMSIARRASSLMSLMNPNRKGTGDDAFKDASTSAWIPQSIAAYSLLRMPGHICDAKVGLNYLVLDNTSVESYLKHQNITVSYSFYPIGCPQQPCVGPTLCKLSYFRSGNKGADLITDSDKPLGEAILRWCQEADQPCKQRLQQKMEEALPSKTSSPASLGSTTLDRKQKARSANDLTEKSSSSELSSEVTAKVDNQQLKTVHGCDQPFKDHVLCFAHGTGRISIYINAEESDTTRNDRQQNNLKEIEAWMVCSICEATTEKTILSPETYHYSLAKYLELIFYDTHFLPPSVLCSHATSKSTIVRCFRPRGLGSGVTVKMAYEDSAVYELRMPRLQVAPDNNHEPVEEKDDRGSVSTRTLMQWQNQLQQDLDGCFAAISTHIGLLEQYIRAEIRREMRAHASTETFDHQHLREKTRTMEHELTLLRQSLLEKERKQMTDSLKDTPLDSLNDFRRLFAARAPIILSELSQWQQHWCRELVEECAWDPPDYVRSDKVHCFPGSSVVVREDEPSSFIAYTLSSKEYLDELLQSGAEGIAGDEPKASADVPKTSDESYASKEEAGKKKPYPNIVDGYYSMVKRKYIVPSTGASSEAPSFRSMVLETVKTNASELRYYQQRRWQDIKGRWYSKAHKPSAGDRSPLLGHFSWWEKPHDKTRLKSQTSERVISGETMLQHDIMTEVKTSSYYHMPSDSKGKQDMSPENNNEKPLPALNGRTDTREAVSPHIKHKYTHNDIEFTCIVYYASEFEALRRQSGIDQLMVPSLTRCSAWKTTGGKSKSHFYRSQDSRLVIKEMVNAWNNVEKESILKFAPKYFEHMKKSVETPSILAKIFGFYTIRMRNVTNNRVLLDLDVLVMEHLFYGTGPTIARVFDLKGLRNRHVEEYQMQARKSDTTLWDGDWLQEYRLALPVHEQSKALVEASIKNDTEFLAKGNIMDYSLLVGLDLDRKELTVGIVDFIGAYTWYKKVESKSKSTLRPHKEVTVVPPEQYRWRFCRMIEDYFVAVPGKFDKIPESHIQPSALIT